MNIVLNALANKCPQCLKGSVFRGPFSMNRACPVCGHVFEKEPGYFLGATVAAYFIGCFSVVPTLIVCWFVLKLELLTVIAIAVAQILLLQPLLYYFSRLIWLHVENRMTRSLDERRS
jgi:uncharacterized protein (DUF983 family)